MLQGQSGKNYVITIAKGLTSAYAPLSGTILSEKIWKVLEQGTDAYGPIGHGWTYSAHPISVAAGVVAMGLFMLALKVSAKNRAARTPSPDRQGVNS